jgi:hypothetical protein
MSAPTRRRDPLCPACGYNLVGSPRAPVMTCPECGEEFPSAEVRWSRLPGDWTPLKGVLLAARFLVSRSLLASPGIIGIIWLLTPLMNTHAWGAHRGVLVLAAAGIGAGLGWMWVRWLPVAAGFTSPWLVVMATLATLGVTLGCVTVCDTMRPLAPRAWWALVVLPTAITFLWMTVETVVQSRRY